MEIQKCFAARPYDPERDFARWNDMISQCRQASFLFDRRYMDYHSNRFTDASLMIAKGDRLVALFPASLHDEGRRVASHGGLTYGGLLTTRRATAADVAGALDAMNEYYAASGVKTVVYKPTPYIYHTAPADEDLYHLWRTVGMQLTGRQISSTIDRDNRPRMFEIRRRGLRRAVEAGVKIERSTDFAPFWEILTSNLMERYATRPVHTLAEITLLAQRFPQAIELHVARRSERVVAGTVLYKTPMTTHAQYITASPEGKEIGALDALFDAVITRALESTRYFDFGISTEQHGNFLNESLLYQKEGFGGRATLYDIYTYSL